MRIQLSVHDTQTVTPQMIASMTVLQCGVQELTEYLEEMSYENPLVELQEPERKAPEQKELLDKLRWLKNSDRQNQTYYADPDRDSVDQYLHRDPETTLARFLREQILTLKADPAERNAMETLTDLLDERGLFTGTVGEIAKLAGCSRETAGRALETVRGLEPAGVAAESIQASLLRQLRGISPRNGLAEQLLREHFRHLGAWPDSRLAKAMNVSEEAVRTAKEVLASLNPYPANGFAGREEIRYITPDLSIVPGESGLIVTAEEGYLPTVRVNAEYLRLLESSEEPEVQKYLKQKLRQLEQVVANVDRRKSTLLRCGEVIAARQASFFQGGPLQKLTLRDVAEELGLHESTISRAVKNKYIQCERGILPMSRFFGRGAGQNYGICRSGIQSIMEEILAGEDKRHPLSDEKIVRELARRHITLSRRAVAKYRAEMGIPAASARKRLD